MTVEPTVGRRAGEPGWTVSWRGRGWWDSLDAYVQLVEDALAIAGDRRVPVIPSVKFHLPAAADDDWRAEEYARTMEAIGGAFARSGRRSLLIEKDFSPTLAGSDRASTQATVVDREKDAEPGKRVEQLPSRLSLSGGQCCSAQAGRIFE